MNRVSGGPSLLDLHAEGAGQLLSALEDSLCRVFHVSFPHPHSKVT